MTNTTIRQIHGDEVLEIVYWLDSYLKTRKPRRSRSSPGLVCCCCSLRLRASPHWWPAGPSGRSR